MEVQLPVETSLAISSKGRYFTLTKAQGTGVKGGEVGRMGRREAFLVRSMQAQGQTGVEQEVGHLGQILAPFPGSVILLSRKKAKTNKQKTHLNHLSYT